MYIRSVQEKFSIGIFVSKLFVKRAAYEGMLEIVNFFSARSGKTCSTSKMQKINSRENWI